MLSTILTGAIALTSIGCASIDTSSADTYMAKYSRRGEFSRPTPAESSRPGFVEFLRAYGMLFTAVAGQNPVELQNFSATYSDPRAIPPSVPNCLRR